MRRREFIAGTAAVGAILAVGEEDAMQALGKTRILFIAGFGPIVRDVDAGRKLYVEALQIPFKEESGGYLHTSALQGAKAFALWPLSQAAESCFGSPTWPSNLPVPHAWLEFDVDSVERATAELESKGYPMLVKNRKEPWGQTVSRFLDSDGLLIGLTFTPWMRDKS
jgi:catechol 2,3-dioxygenase-like lactoylglutathione lyase family enzyme